jgi:hypothetical protein
MEVRVPIRTQDTTLATLPQLVAVGELLTSYGIPVLPIKHRSKIPIPHPTTRSWWTIEDPDDVEPMFRQVFATLGAHGPPNLAMICGRARASPVLVVDIDGASGLAKAQELGVTSAADCWVQRTGRGRGGWHIVYSADADLELRRHVRPQGVDLDLVVNGYTLVEPSITEAPYCWQPGHGPSDTPLANLDSPPAALLAWWQTVEEGTPAKRHASADSRIPEGARNETLASLAGTMRRRGMGQAAILAALLEENSTRCQPPLPEADVRRVASSVARYAPASISTGHFRGVQPARLWGQP